MNQYDALIIGFGKGGKTLAAHLAGLGQKVAVVERSRLMYGGTCLNIGCIPTKALVHSAHLASQRRPDSFAERNALYQQARADKDAVVTLWRQKSYDNLNNHPNVTVFTGEASFLSPNTVRVDGEQPLELSAKEIFINTGATPVLPGIPGLRESRHVYTSTTLLDLSELPRRLTVIGSGYIGLEFASMYAEFGSQVTVLEATGLFLPREDRDIAAEVQKVMEQKGITFRFNAAVERIQDAAQGAVITFTDADGVRHDLDADAILVATGRQPNVAALNLAAAGVEQTERGFIRVDETLRTNVPHIWALGDVNGGPQFTYISLDDFRIVRDRLFGERKRTTTDRQNVPYSMFIDPPLSRIGLTESEAVRMGYQVKVARLPAAASTRAHTLKQTDGLMKAVVDTQTGRILGAALLSAESNEVISIIQMAMNAGLPYTSLRDNIFTHPSMGENLNDLFALIDRA